MVQATAEVLLGPDARVVRDAIHRKHWLTTKLMGIGTFVTHLFRKGDDTECAIRMVLAA